MPGQEPGNRVALVGRFAGRWWLRLPAPGGLTATQYGSALSTKRKVRVLSSPTTIAAAQLRQQDSLIEATHQRLAKEACVKPIGSPSIVTRLQQRLRQASAACGLRRQSTLSSSPWTWPPRIA